MYLSVMDCQELFNSYVDQLSPVTINDIRRRLKVVLGAAVEQGLLRQNVASLTRPIHEPKKEVIALSEKQVESLVKALDEGLYVFPDKDKPYKENISQIYNKSVCRVLVHLALDTGCRIGELLGLTWSCIGLNGRSNGQIKIIHSLSSTSEGVKLEDGRYVCELADDVHAVDAFGHKALTGTARYLANVVARNLDTKTRCIELSTLQRCAGHLTSRTDITEAYQVGGAAAKAAFEGVTGQMVALKRISNSPYQCTTELHPISEVANLEKKVPLSWMNENHTQMTEDFLAYARPLIQAELTPLYIAGLPHHIYMKPQK